VTAVRDTPVFGTAQPPQGISGLVRRRAYAIPEHRVRHWMLLLLADRLDLLEYRLGGGSRPLAIAALAGGVALGLGALGVWRRSRR
jgi:hypothetical protein